MKKIGEIMLEMGFNKNAPDSVKESFIKHLIKASNTKSNTELNKKVVTEKKAVHEKIEQQLDLFDYAERKVV